MKIKRIYKHYVRVAGLPVVWARITPTELGDILKYAKTIDANIRRARTVIKLNNRLRYLGIEEIHMHWIFET